MVALPDRIKKGGKRESKSRYPEVGLQSKPSFSLSTTSTMPRGHLRMSSGLPAELDNGKFCWQCVPTHEPFDLAHQVDYAEYTDAGNDANVKERTR